MKKYIAPEMFITKLHMKVGVMTITSCAVDPNETVEQQLIKGESSSPSRYNVWDDDWSAN